MIARRKPLSVPKPAEGRGPGETGRRATTADAFPAKSISAAPHRVVPIHSAGRASAVEAEG